MPKKIRGNIDEEQVQAHFGLLHRAGDITVLSGIASNGRIWNGFYDNEGDFVAAVKSLAGVANVYVGVNSWGRIPAGGKLNAPPVLGQLRGGNDFINRVRRLLIDVDVNTARRQMERRTSGTPVAAIKEELLMVSDLVEEMTGAPPLHDAAGLIVFSGNGQQIVPLLDIPLDDDNRIEIAAKLKVMGEYIQRRYRRDGVKIDSTFDLPRIMALAGTLKMKGDNPALWRIVRIIDDLPGDDPDAFQDFVLSREPDSTTGSATTETVTLPNVPVKEPNLCGPWRRLYDGKARIGDRSMVIIMLGAKFHSMGYSSNENVALLQRHDAMTLHKYTNRPEQYSDIVKRQASHRVADCGWIEKVLNQPPECKGCKRKSQVARKPQVRTVPASNPEPEPDEDPFEYVRRAVRKALK